MYYVLIALAAALCGVVAVAQPADTLTSAECRQALASVQAQEAALLAARHAQPASGESGSAGPDARLEALRRHAAQVCLGRAAAPPLATHRLTQPPLAVPPIGEAPPPAWTLALPGGRASEPQAGPPRPSLKQIQPPPILVACDALGCWASDGTRLVRAGPHLLGPRGLCSVQGTLLQCP